MPATLEDPFPAPEDLLRHGGFLRSLARGLVHDEHDCEDLVQQAWTSALCAPPPERGGLRAWLATVVRSRARNLLRDRARRHDLERSVARPEAAPAEDVADALELQARVLEAVRGLREPYRTAIWLRYFHDLPPREIATRLGLSAASVDSRLVRGRRLLREALGRGSRGERAWLGLLLPLAGPSKLSRGPGTLAAHVLGGGLVGTKLKLLLALVVATGLVGVWRWSASRPTAAGARPEPGPRAEALQAPPGNETLVGTPPEGAAREAVPARSSPGEAPASAPAVTERSPGLVLRGRVIDTAGAPVPSAGLRFVPERDGEAAEGGSARVVRARSDAAGAFRIVDLPGPGRVVADEPGLTTVLSGSLDEGGFDVETVVVVAPTGELLVRVGDDDGAPLEGALVRLRIPEALRRRLALDLESSQDVALDARTDADGAARFAACPRLPGAVVRAERNGYAAAERALSAEELATGVGPLLVLRRLERAEGALVGRVVDAWGDGLEGVEVTYGIAHTRTEPDGVFRFELDAAGRGWGPEEARHDLTAVRPGYLPARLRPELDAGGFPLWPDPLVLQPVEEALSIAGRVVDQDGAPLPGYLVFLPETELFDSRPVEGVVAGESAFLHAVRSDARGRFELPGLLARAYDLAAIDPATLVRGRTDGVEAGEREATVVVDRRRVWERVEGRCVDARGFPLSEVAVRAVCKTQVARGARGVWADRAEGELVATDEEGRFTLRQVPREGVQLSFEHPDVLHVDTFELPEAPDPDARVLRDVVVPLELRLRFQVVLRDPDEADELRVLGPEGEPLPLYVQTANFYAISDDNGLLEEGRSKHVFVGEAARTLVLLRAGAEVRRVALELAPGPENRLEL